MEAHKNYKVEEVMMTLGRGSVNYSSMKQSIVSKSSTEAEIVRVSDGLGLDIGLMYLLQSKASYALSRQYVFNNSYEKELIYFADNEVYVGEICFRQRSY